MLSRVHAASLLLGMAGLSGCAAWPRGGGAGPREVADAYLAAWSAADYAAMSRHLATASPNFVSEHEAFQKTLAIVSSRFEVLRLREDEAGAATAHFRAEHLLRGLGAWTVEAELPLAQRDGRWQVRWSTRVLHPELRAGDRLSRGRTRPARADVLDGRGEPLTREGEVIAIGINPARVVAADEVATALEDVLQVDPSRVHALFESAGRRDVFLSVIELRPERFRQVRGTLEPVPGIFFRRRQARLSPAEGFAAHTLGRVGEITAERLAELGLQYQAGDTVGLSGVERAFEVQLAGTPTGEVQLVTPSGVARVLHRFEGTPPQSVQLTLLPELQRAAESALAGVTQPAALVAVEIDTGAIRALVSRPLGGALHRALSGRYPPGSTFKIVTTEALLESGLSPGSPVQCPPEVRVDGKAFRNFEGESFGTTDLRTAFAHSCNTAFITLADRLEPEALTRAAGRFGFDVEYDVGLPTGASRFPPPESAVEHAAAAIGQGRILATPVHLASVAAAARSGVWRAPFLVEREETARIRLAAGADEVLPDLMRAVVTSGTARAAAGQVEGLAGKTGTAEFGQARPPRTHAWFVGFKGGIAFAVLVEGGGTGGKVAAPIAARFAEAL